jgi:hypothetical protein
LPAAVLSILLAAPRDTQLLIDTEDAMFTYGISESSDSEYGTAYMTTDITVSLERVLFAADEVLIDSQASVNVFKSKHLLRNIRKSHRSVILNGVQSGASGVSKDLESDFNELGALFCSEEASANILSLAQLVDSGGDVRYEAELDQFTLRPPTSNSLYIFRRKDVAGSEGRFYVCQLSTMVESAEISAADQHQLALAQTVEDNMQRYTKHEVGGATRARDMLSKMGYPSVQKAYAVSRLQRLD